MRIWLVLSISLALAQEAMAQPPAPRIVPLGDSLTLQGLVESEPIEVQAPLWVTLQGWPDGLERPKLSLWLSEAIVGSGSGSARQLTNVVLPTETTLENGRPTRIEITVKDVAWPGQYVGKLHYRVEIQKAIDEEEGKDQNKNQTTLELLKRAATDLPGTGLAGEIGLRLDVRTKPRVVALESKLKLSLVNCWWGWSCALASLFVPDETTPGPWRVRLRNDSLGEVEIEPETDLSREGSLSLAKAFALVPREADTTEPARKETQEGTGSKAASTRVGIGKPANFDFSVDRGQISPGSYGGNLNFRVEPYQEPPLQDRGPDSRSIVRNRTDVSVTAEVDVRSGVFWVLLLVFVGVIAGRLNRQISTPAARARLKLYGEMVQVDERIADLDPASKETLRALLNKIRSDINSLDVSDETIRLALDELKEKVSSAENLQGEERVVAQLRKTATITAAAGRAGIDTLALDHIEAEIADARVKIDGEVEPVQESLQTIRSMIRLAESGGSAASVKALAPATAATAQPVPEQPSKLVKNFAYMMAILAGTRELSVSQKFWYVQPLASLALLLALTIYGVFLLYAGPENSTFGAKGIADYVTLFLWGFGSDILTKGLQDITFTRG